MTAFFLAHWLDIVTTVLGLLYIWLEYRASIWLWIVGFLMQALGIVLYYDKGLYADCAMEFYYLTMTIYGFWRWMPTSNPSQREGSKNASSTMSDLEGNQSPLPSGGVGSGSIRHFPSRLVVPWLAIIVAVWGIIYWLLVAFTNSTVPLADSFTTALSIIGIWALAHKYLEQWFIWIAVDVVTCVLYAYKDIPFKAGLYGLYVVIAVFGYRKWRTMMKKGEEVKNI